jgi:hypothetical protein
MQQFACVQARGTDTAYMPLHAFTAVDLGYQKDAATGIINKLETCSGAGALRQPKTELEQLSR